MPHPYRRTYLHHEHGQTLAEYAILVGGIAVVVAVAIPLVGTAVTGFFTAFVSAAFGR
jgi:Flp pilus assembly pilin Flp